MLHRDYGYVGLYLRHGEQYASVAYARLEKGELYIGVASLLGYQFKVSQHVSGRAHAQLIPPHAAKGVQVDEARYEEPLAGMTGWTMLGAGGGTIPIADLRWTSKIPKQRKTDKQARKSAVLKLDVGSMDLYWIPLFAAAAYGDQAALDSAIDAMQNHRFYMLTAHAWTEWTDPVLIGGIALIRPHIIESALAASNPESGDTEEADATG